MTPAESMIDALYRRCHQGEALQAKATAVHWRLGCCRQMQQQQGQDKLQPQEADAAAQHHDCGGSRQLCRSWEGRWCCVSVGCVDQRLSWRQHNTPVASRVQQGLGANSPSLSDHDPRTCRDDLFQLSSTTICLVPARQGRNPEGRGGSGNAIFGPMMAAEPAGATLMWQQPASTAPLCSRQARRCSDGAYGGIRSRLGTECSALPQAVWPGGPFTTFTDLPLTCARPQPFSLHPTQAAVGI